MRLFACALATVVIGVALTGTADARSTCLSPGYKTIYANRSGGIFRTASGIRKHRDGFYVCLFRYGYRLRLGGNHPPRHFSFGGHFFAASAPAGFEAEGGGPTPPGIALYDLSRARRAARYVFSTASVPLPAGRAVTGDPVTALVVTANGGAAWIAKPLPGSADYQVLTTEGHAFRRALRVLDAGPGINPKSLRRVSRSSVSWTSNGVVHQAVLPSN
jgi:hypothetical protein